MIIPLSQFKMDKKKFKEIDKWMLFSIIALVLFGILNIYLATKPYAYNTAYIIKQSLFFGISLVALYLVMAIDYNIIKGFTPLFYWISIALLVLVLIVGKAVNGAQGWINLGIVSFQPAELAKVATIMMMGKKLEEMDGNINNFRNFCILAIYAIIPAALIVIQPDMGMTMVLFFMVVGVFLAGGLDKRIIIGGFTGLIVAIVIVWNSGLIQPYQKMRIISFQNPEANSSEEGYHLRQSLIGIGSGGFLGTQNPLSKDNAGGYASQYVPEVETDFIFAQIGEQWGLVGAVFLLSLYGILICRMIAIARDSKDMFGSIISIGMTSYLLFAIWQNIGMTIGLMPITGITLPLVSYGGSSLLTTILSLGLVLNVGMRKKKLYF